jgi:tetratricopeptide (TPR) repeat protein
MFSAPFLAIGLLVTAPAGILEPAIPGLGARAISEASQSNVETLRNQALEEGQSRKTDDAIRDYQRVLEQLPDWKEGWWNLGMLEYSSTKFRDAQVAFQRVVALAPRVGNVWALLGLCEYETGDYDKALQHLEQARALGIQDDEEIARVSSYHLGLLYIRSGQFERATTVLPAGFSNGTISPEVKLAWGLAALRVPLLPKDLDPSREALVEEVGAAGAVRDVERMAALVKLNPDAPNLQLAFDETIAARDSDKRPQEEAQPTERVLEFYANADAKKASAGPGGQDVWTRALSAYAAGDYSAAEVDLKRWLAANPSIGTAWAMLGLCEYSQRDYDNALVHLDRSARLGMHASPESIDQARYTYGVLLVRSGRFDEADSVLATARHPTGALSLKVELALGLSLLRRAELPESIKQGSNPGDADLIGSAGRIAVLLQHSQYDAAFPLFKALLERYPKAPFLHYAYGTALLAVSEFDQAAGQMQVERAISPESELPCVRLASIALRQHDTAHAMEWAAHALELNHDSVESHYLLGRALLEAGETTAAVQHLEIAAKLSPASPEIHFNLARAYAKANMPEKAQRERETFTQLNQSQPQSAPAVDPK